MNSITTMISQHNLGTILRKCSIVLEGKHVPSLLSIQPSSCLQMITETSGHLRGP